MLIELTFGAPVRVQNGSLVMASAWDGRDVCLALFFPGPEVRVIIAPRENRRRERCRTVRSSSGGGAASENAGVQRLVHVSGIGVDSGSPSAFHLLCFKHRYI